MRALQLEQELRVCKSQEQSLLERLEEAEQLGQEQELAIKRLQEEKALASSQNQQLEWRIDTLNSEQERVREGREWVGAGWLACGVRDRGVMCGIAVARRVREGAGGCEGGRTGHGAGCRETGRQAGGELAGFMGNE